MRTPTIYANEVSDDRLAFVTVMEDMAPAEPGSQLIGESLEHVRVAMGEAAKLAAAFYGDESVGAHDFVMSQVRDDGGALVRRCYSNTGLVFCSGLAMELMESARRSVPSMLTITLALPRVLTVRERWLMATSVVRTSSSMETGLALSTGKRPARAAH